MSRNLVARTDGRAEAVAVGSPNHAVAIARIARRTGYNTALVIHEIFGMTRCRTWRISLRKPATSRPTFFREAWAVGWPQPRFPGHSARRSTTRCGFLYPRRAERLGLNFDGECAFLLGVKHGIVIDSRAAVNIETDILDVHAN